MPGRNASFVNGHNNPLRIRVVGMTFERALEIAIASDRKRNFTLGKSRPIPVSSGHGNGHRISDEQKRTIAVLTAQGVSARNIAVRLGVTDRSVTRVRANERKTA
jgi:DNA-binding NarL/FixJ family response regulator